MRESILDLSNAGVKSTFITHIRSLEGPHRITVIKYRKRRTDNQNGYYFGVIIPYCLDYLIDQGWDDATEETAHEQLKELFGLRETQTNHKTGENKEIIRSTSTYDTMEFSAYNERCCKWLAEGGVVVPPPDPFYNSNKHEDQPTPLL